MRSERPKPLHLLCGRPMILHVLDAMAEVDVRRVVVVVGHRAEWVTKTLVQHAPPTMEIEFVEQLTRTGTGDALAVGLTGCPTTMTTRSRTWSSSPATRRCCARRRWPRWCGPTGPRTPAPRCSPPWSRTPRGYGRVVHGKDGDVTRVVEEADATDEEKAHRRGQHLHLLLPAQHPGARPCAGSARPTPRASTT